MTTDAEKVARQKADLKAGWDAHAPNYDRSQKIT